MRGGIAGAVGVLLAGLSVAAPASAELAAAKPLGCTGGQQTYTVPAGVTWLAITAAGAPGWDTTSTGADSNDGYEVFGDVPVTPGEPLYAEVGQAGLASGAATFGGGGAGGTGSLDGGASGGGASDVRTCSILATSCSGGGTSLSSRLIVGAGGAGSGGDGIGTNAPAAADLFNSLGGDGCTEGQTLHSCATETVASGTVIEGGEAYGGNNNGGSGLTTYTPASGGTDTGGAGSVIPESTLTYSSQHCQMSGSAAGAAGEFGFGGTGGSGNQNGGGGGGGGYFGGGGGGSGRTASGQCDSPAPDGIGAGGGTGSSFLSVALVNTSFEGDEDNSGTETDAGVTLQPLIQLNAPVNGGFYTKGQVVHASYDCYYASYPASYCQGSQEAPGGSPVITTSGAAIDTGTVGKHTFTVFNNWASGQSKVITTITYTVSGPSGGGLTKGSSSISGATGKHPKLTVEVSAPHGESISKVTIHPPSGFAFIPSQLRHGVSASGATRELVSHGSLVVLLKHSVSSVSIKVSDGAFRLSGKVAKKIKRGKLKSVIFTVDASLSTGSIAQLSLTTRL